MKKIQSPKVRLAVSLLKIFGIILLIGFAVLLTKSLDMHPALTVVMLVLAGGIIRFLYRFICMIARLIILILILCALCLI